MSKCYFCRCEVGDSQNNVHNCPALIANTTYYNSKDGQPISQHVVPEKPKFPRVWEVIYDGSYRLKVFGGWVIQCVGGARVITFVPDPNHEWELE